MIKVMSKYLNDGLTSLSVPIGSTILSIKVISNRASIFIQYSNSEERETLEIFPFSTGSEIPESFLKDFTYIDTVSVSDYVLLHYFYRIYDDKEMVSLFEIMAGKSEATQEA